MRVIVSTHDSVHPVRGGGGLRTIESALEFKRRGHDVVLIAPTDGVGLVQGLRTEWLHGPRKHRSQLLSSLKFNVRMARKYLKFLGKTDMVFVHNTIAAACLPLMKPFFSFTLVLDLTDIHAEYFAAHETSRVLRKLLGPVLLWIEYRIIRAADRVIVVTEAMKALLVRHGVSAARVSVVYDGCQTERFSTEKKPQAERTVLHLGIVDRQHGVEYLIQAIPAVLKSHPDARFLIVGGGRTLDDVKAMARRLGVSDSCVFTGHLPTPEARQYLSKAAIGVIPRADTLANRIVTTLKIYEYWASGTAVVSSRLEGVAEIATAEENVLFFEPGRADDLAQKISQLLEDDVARARLQRNGWETVQQYQWGALARQIVDFSLNGKINPIPAPESVAAV